MLKNAIDKKISVAIGRAMSAIERGYHVGDMGYWFEDAGELYDESGYNPEEFEEMYPKVLAAHYQSILKKYGMEAIDEALAGFLMGHSLLEDIIRDPQNDTETKDAILAMERYINPEHKSYDLLQEYIQRIKTLPLYNMHITMEVMGKYMFHVNGFGRQSNDFGTIGRLTGGYLEPKEYDSYDIRAMIKPREDKGCNSRAIAIVFKFDKDKVTIGFKVAHQGYLNEKETVVGLGHLVHDFTTKEFVFSGNSDEDSKNLDNLVCRTLEECKPEFEKYLEENPNDRPIPFGSCHE